MAYTKTVWVDGQLPAINAEHLNNIENGIKTNEDLIESIILGENNKGTFTPSIGQEYPLTPVANDVWYIDGLTGAGYVYTTGDLIGQTADNFDKLLYTLTGWHLVEDTQNYVHNSGDESIDGIKTFSSSPILPTPSVGDSSTKAATTQHVSDKIAAIPVSTNSSARNTILSTAAAGALAQAVTPTPSFNTVIYTGNGTSQDIVTGLKSYDPNWVSGRAYSLLNEQDAYCIHNYYIYKLLADVTSATTPDADPTKWEVQADGVSVPWFNSQVWIKSRSAIASNNVYDTLRGASKSLFTEQTAAELNEPTKLTSFYSNGFSIGANVGVNGSGTTYVAWQEQFDTMVSGTTNQGKRYITASNAQSGKGMSIYVGSGTAGHEIPHGLSAKLDFAVGKNRDVIGDWLTYNSIKGGTEYQQLNTNIASTANIGPWNNTDATDATLTLGTSGAVNTVDVNYVAYFSSNRANHTVTKMYQGTGVAGNVVDLGLDMTQAGAKVMIKSLSGTAGWVLFDNIRSGGTTLNDYLLADTSDAEVVNSATVTITATINGVVIDGTALNINSAGATYLIEAVVPNYDKPNGGLNRPAGNILSFAEGVDGTTGDLDSIETTTSVDFSLTAGAKNYLFADKGNTVVASTVKMLKGLDRVSADKWGVVSPSDATLKTTAKHSDYASATGVVSASSTTTTNYSYLAFSKDISSGVINGWLALGTTGYLQYETSEPRIVKSYKMYSRFDASSFPTREAKDWTLQGSNDGINWDILDTVIGNTTAISNGLKYYSGVLGNTTAYTYYRVNITLNNGDVSYVGIGELELNTEHPAGYFHDVEKGLVVDATDTPSSRIRQGEVVVDALGEAILDTLVVYPKTNDFVDVEVHGDLTVHGDVSGKNICTAWVNFDGTTTPPTIRDSYNVSDVVRTATGQFDVYFAVPMDNIGYSMSGMCSIGSTTIGGIISLAGASPNAIDKVSVYIESDASVALNSAIATINVFGGK